MIGSRPAAQSRTLTETKHRILRTRQRTKLGGLHLTLAADGRSSVLLRRTEPVSALLHRRRTSLEEDLAPSTIAWQSRNRHTYF